MYVHVCSMPIYLQCACVCMCVHVYVCVCVCSMHMYLQCAYVHVYVCVCMFILVFLTLEQSFFIYLGNILLFQYFTFTQWAGQGGKEKLYYGNKQQQIAIGNEEVEVSLEM